MQGGPKVALRFRMWVTECQAASECKLKARTVCFLNLFIGLVLFLPSQTRTRNTLVWREMRFSGSTTYCDAYIHKHTNKMFIALENILGEYYVYAPKRQIAIANDLSTCCAEWLTKAITYRFHSRSNNLSLSLSLSLALSLALSLSLSLSRTLSLSLSLSHSLFLSLSLSPSLSLAMF